MGKKQNLGQFYTTNSQYIIGNLINEIPEGSIIVDPFAGNFDLLNLFSDKYNKIAYDIDPKNDLTIQQDTLLNPPDYRNSWIITNPPYLAKNKNKDKTIYNKYSVNDLYKAFLKTIFECNGGVIILPLNFLCDEDNDIRVRFFSNFTITNLNIFEETVFDDTSYTVCSFSFIKQNSKNIINSTIYPSNKKSIIEIDEKYGYRIGGKFYDLIDIESTIKVSRLIKNSKQIPNTNINLRAIDTGGKDGRIGLFFGEHLYGLVTDRSFATIILSKDYSIDVQKQIIEEFNRFIEENREKYNSLFLTNFRNSTKNYARKRISFETAYKIIQYIINNSNLE